MRRTVPSRCDRADGNCDRLVGRQDAGRKSGIWLAVVRDGRLVESRARPTREEAIALRAATARRRSSSGFDFSFGVPGVVRTRARLHDDRRRLGARRRATASGGSRRRRRSGATAATCRASGGSGACEARYPTREVDLPARRQRTGRRGIGAGHAAARAPARGRHRDLAVRRARRSHRRSRSTRRALRTLRRPTPAPFANEHERDAVVLGARHVGASRNGRGVERRDRSDDPPRGRHLGALRPGTDYASP